MKKSSLNLPLSLVFRWTETKSITPGSDVFERGSITWAWLLRLSNLWQQHVYGWYLQVPLLTGLPHH